MPLSSIFRFLKNQDRTVHIQLWKNIFRITDIESKKVLEFSPFIAYEMDSKGNGKLLGIGKEAEAYRGGNITVVNPMLHPRVIIDNFMAMEIMFEYTIKHILKPTNTLFAPKVIVEPMEKYEGGLTMVEHKMLYDIAMNAGAREVIVKDGEKIIDKDSFRL
jgi:rod shape-determining protein MreB